jgi:hypothetical protein
MGFSFIILISAEYRYLNLFFLSFFVVESWYMVSRMSHTSISDSSYSSIFRLKYKILVVEKEPKRRFSEFIKIRINKIKANRIPGIVGI